MKSINASLASVSRNCVIIIINHYYHSTGVPQFRDFLVLKKHRSQASLSSVDLPPTSHLLVDIGEEESASPLSPRSSSPLPSTSPGYRTLVQSLPGVPGIGAQQKSPLTLMPTDRVASEELPLAWSSLHNPVDVSGSQHTTAAPHGGMFSRRSKDDCDLPAMSADKSTMSSEWCWESLFLFCLR